MANVFKKKEYDEVKNATYTLVFFKDGKRTLTYGGLSLYRVAKEMKMRSERGHMALMFDNDKVPTDGLSWDLKDYLPNEE